MHYFPSLWEMSIFVLLSQITCYQNNLTLLQNWQEKFWKGETLELKLLFADMFSFIPELHCSGFVFGVCVCACVHSFKQHDVLNLWCASPGSYCKNLAQRHCPHLSQSVSGVQQSHRMSTSNLFPGCLVICYSSINLCMSSKICAANPSMESAKPCI